MPKGRVYTTKNWTCVNVASEPKKVIRYRNDKPNANTLLKFAIVKSDGEAKAVLVTKCHKKGGGGHPRTVGNTKVPSHTSKSKTTLVNDIANRLPL